MAQPDFTSVVPEFSLNGAGVFGPNAALGYARFYTASGGMVGLGQVNPSGVFTGIKNAGPQGFPGFGATLVGTGRYNVMHPPSTIVAVAPQIAAPSGRSFQANQFRGVASGFVGDASIPGFPLATGITQIQVFETPTGGAQLANPPTGCRFDLLFYVAPNNVAGLTQF